MKYIFIILFLISNLFAQHKDYSPTIADYEEKIQYFENVSKNLFSEKTWEKIILESKYNKKEIKFDSLDDFNRKLFCFTMANRTLNSFLKMEEHWQEEIKKFDNPNYKLINSAESRPATKTEVITYTEKIKNMRKLFANDFDKFNQEFFIKYQNQLTIEEIKSYNYKIQNAKK